MTIIKVNNTNIAFEQHGEGDDLILIGGFACNRTIWYPYIDVLKKHYRVLIFDNRGVGESEAPTTFYTIREMATDIAALMKALSISSAHFVGQSMGSSILMQLALDYPKLIKKGILSAPFARFPEIGKFQLSALSNLMQVGTDMRLVMENVLPWLYSGEFLSDPKRVEQIFKNMLENPYPQSPEGYSGQAQALLHIDLEDRLSEIQIPFLLIAGDEDVYTPLRFAKKIHESIPHSTLTVLPKTGHAINLERIEKMISLILEVCK